MIYILPPSHDSAGTTNIDAPVNKDINTMMLTVRNELKDTIGEPRPYRKVQPYKEANKRMTKQTK